MNKLNILCHGDLLKVLVSNGEHRTIYSGKLDISELVEWFLTNESSIRTKLIPYDILRGEDKSLATMIEDFYEQLDVDVAGDEVIDAMYAYRSAHGLRFGCRGIDFPEVYIGKNDGKHEISLCTEAESWRYFIDIEDLFSTIRRLKVEG